MANTLRIKRRTAGNAGAPATLSNAELAFNEVNNTLYYGKGDNGSGVATSVIAIGGDGTFATKAYVDAATPVGVAYLAQDNTWDATKTNTFNGTVNLEGTFKIDDVTVLTSAAELNLLDGAAPGMTVNSKAVVYGPGGELEAYSLNVNTTLNALTLSAGTGLFSVDASGNVSTSNSGTFGTLAVAVDQFTVDNSGNVYAAGDVEATGSGAFSTLHNVSGTFNVDGAGNVYCEGTLGNGFFSVDTGGNVYAAGNVQATGSGSFGGDLAAVNEKFTVNSVGSGAYVQVRDGSIELRDSALSVVQSPLMTVFTLASNGDVTSAGVGTFGSLAVAVDQFTVDNIGNVFAVGTISTLAGLIAANGSFEVTPAGELYAESGAFSGSGSFTGNLTIGGDLTVNGTTTTINSTTLSVDDKNIVLGDVATPSNATADGGGITLKGTTDKTLNWVSATGAWTSSEDFNLVTGKVYEINGTSVLSATALGSGVVSSSLTSVGTITSGTWTGTTIAVANGGTGATDAAGARTNLGLVIGTNVQAYDAELAALAGLTSAANALPYFTGAGTADVTTLSSFGRTLIDDADAAAARTTLGLVIGTNVQAQDPELAAIAGLTSAADRLPYFTGSGTASLAVFTAFGRSLADDADAAAGRTTLGLGSIATQDASNVSITGGAIDNVVLDGGTF